MNRKQAYRWPDWTIATLFLLLNPTDWQPKELFSVFLPEYHDPCDTCPTLVTSNAEQNYKAYKVLNVFHVSVASLQK